MCRGRSLFEIVGDHRIILYGECSKNSKQFLKHEIQIITIIFRRFFNTPYTTSYNTEKKRVARTQIPHTNVSHCNIATDNIYRKHGKNRKKFVIIHVSYRVPVGGRSSANARVMSRYTTVI